MGLTAVNRNIAIAALVWLIYNTVATELDNMLKPPDDMDGVYQAISAISNPPRNQVGSLDLLTFSLHLSIACGQSTSRYLTFHTSFHPPQTPSCCFVPCRFDSCPCPSPRFPPTVFTH